ncbi:phage tail sheath subtilisin-like domain-containing protein [Gluconobacter japonicus]|uniref:phage tail sheath subtilisin-like domain-containing protein n=1 Tax=Gluconobacter japonicus TaxID=376620 RepID=UPI0039EADBCB
MPNFQQIPGDWALPGSYTEIRDVPDPNALTGMPVRAVLVGQVSGGAAAVNTVYRNVTAATAPGLFGVGTILTQAATAFSNERPDVALDVVGVAPAVGGVAAKGTITFTGTATSAGTGALMIGGQRFTFAVASGATASDAAAALLASLNTQAAGSAGTVLKTATGLTATASAGVVTLTAGETGDASGGSLEIRQTTRSADQVPGLTVATAAMSGGAGLPDITPALQALGETWYTDIVLAGHDQANISAAVLEARRRNNAMVAKDARVWVGYTGSQGQIAALAAQFSTAEELVLIGATAPYWSPWVLAAVCAAQGAQSLNSDPSRQLRGIALSGLSGLGPSAGNQFSPTQRNVLLGAGCTTLSIARDGTVTFERVVTARQTDPTTGVASGVWDVMLPAIGARVRYEWNSYVTANYYNAKLADDGSPLANSPGVVTCRTLRASWVAQCKLYELQGWIDDVATLGPKAVFTRDATDRNRVNSTLPIKPMGSLIVLANLLQMQV